ncbi:MULTISPECIES: PEP-CTERM sorting domain-containing protein [unclassified Mesorhizobium]|uniref:PEP-CTERM sorting domain-containing protein n=1 Tax=Mesorhizobium sp. ES1-6 TaxID=2876626 RepID=UPI001CCD1A54|nr:PEP-CTERM sorting domain-containing protein [Mesorhizobium sp. CO1-1-4]MBZ9800239.1 PEP-CTERM sorting domain-containing protein [Mesorhizobium sp. ES1-6]
MLPSVSFSDRRWTLKPSTVGALAFDTPFNRDKTVEPSTIGAMAFAAAAGSKSGTAFKRRRRSV